MIKNLLLISMLACTLQAETITGTCRHVLSVNTFTSGYKRLHLMAVTSVNPYKF